MKSGLENATRLKESIASRRNMISRDATSNHGGTAGAAFPDLLFDSINMTNSPDQLFFSATARLTSPGWWVSGLV